MFDSRQHSQTLPSRAAISGTLLQCCRRKFSRFYLETARLRQISAHTANFHIVSCIHFTTMLFVAQRESCSYGYEPSSDPLPEAFSLCHSLGPSKSGRFLCFDAMYHICLNFCYAVRQHAARTNVFRTNEVGRTSHEETASPAHLTLRSSATLHKYRSRHP